MSTQAARAPGSCMQAVLVEMRIFKATKFSNTLADVIGKVKVPIWLQLKKKWFSVFQSPFSLLFLSKLIMNFMDMMKSFVENNGI